jgi:hypothetical protein
MEVRIGEWWPPHPVFKGVVSGKLVVSFDGGIEIWNVGLHRIRAVKEESST